MTNKSDGSSRRLDFGHFVDRFFWFLLTAAALYSATTIKDLGKSIEELNKNMAIVLYQITESKEWSHKTDSRLDRLEQLQRRR